MAARVRPLGDRILVARLEQSRITTGGVVLPDSIREESDRGVVLEVGPGTAQEDGSYREIPVEREQVVLFSPYAGTKISIGSDSFLLLREADVLGVLEGVSVAHADGEYHIAALSETLSSSQV